MEARDDPRDPLEAAWRALGDDWEREEGHRAFVHLAATLERLPDAARRYRGALEDGRRRARAEAGLEAILKRAYATLAPPTRARAPARVPWALPLTVVGIVLSATVLLARALGQPRLASTPVLVAEVIMVALLPWARLAKWR